MPSSERDSAIAVNCLGVLEHGLDIMACAVFEPLEKAPLVAGMAADATLLLDDQQYRVAVAVEADFAHTLHVSRRFALAPEPFARPRPIVSLARRRRTFERFAIHPRQCEHALRRGVLRNGRHQLKLVPAHLIEPRHQLALISRPAAAIAALACAIVNSP